MPIKNVERPLADEYDAYFATYVERVPEGHILPVLEAQISERKPWLYTLDPSAGQHRYAPDKWSLNEVLGHVNDGERVFQYRMLHGARRDPQDLPGFEQDDWARVAGHHERPLAALLDEFEGLRRETIRLIRSFDDTALAATLHADGRPFSVRAIAWILAGHEVHHREVIKERYL
ncbi:MAG: hypothetical protein DHS20C15_15820 [Planctomycetota bacterium]|nr:MAG: hypothetical protein DHS20C15_15820 [Planctomycetota bacterium]